MSELDSVALAPPLAAALTAARWPADHPAVREAAPIAARGHNLVYVAPPSPAWAAPLLAGVASRLLARRAGPVLALAPGEAVDEWARTAEHCLSGAGLRLTAAHAPGRITRLFRTDTVDLAFTTPDTAHELVRRSALRMERLSAILLLWPEAWADDAALAALLQDAPRELQRIVVTADPAAAAPLIDRYCWRAPVVDVAGGDPGDTPPAVRTAPVAWRRRLEALTDLVEQLDPESLGVWSADTTDHAAIGHALAAVGTTATLATGAAPAASLIVAWDLPGPDRLRELAAAGDLLLLVPPGSEAYVARLAPTRRPVHPRGLLDRAQAGLESARRTVAGVLERGAAPASFLAIAPLLERHEAPAVAAALYELWSGERSGQPPAASVPQAKTTVVRLWVGIGRRDAVTPHDLVGTLVKECGVPKEKLGRIEIRETFSLVELAADADPEAVAERMAGKMVRKRRLIARVDRGRPAGRERERPA